MFVCVPCLRPLGPFTVATVATIATAAAAVISAQRCDCASCLCPGCLWWLPAVAESGERALSQGVGVGER